MRKIILLTSYFFVTPSLLLLSILFVSFLSFQNRNVGTYGFFSSNLNSVAYAALPTSDSLMEDRVTQKDARVEIVRQFFAKYNSPLELYASKVISAADEYNLDFRLIPAIAMQESNLCKRIPDDSYNCWGFGIYGKTITRFADYGEAIETVTKTLASKYKNNGLETPEEIMTMYTPSSNGSWANGVNHFMDQLQ